MNLFDEYHGEFQYEPHETHELPVIDHTACMQGKAALDNGDFDLAIACFTEAISHSPDCANGRYNRGVAYVRKGRLDDAIADFTEAIRLSPQDAQLFHDRGLCHALKGDYKKAIADFSEAIRLDPQFAEAHHNRGLAYMGKGEHAKAERDFAKAKQLGFDPQSTGPNGGSHLLVEATRNLAAVQVAYAKHEIRTLMDIEITADLGFVRSPQGAILQFIVEDSLSVNVINISMYRQTLRKCRAAINADAISWRMSDGSLSITGGKNEVTLKFVSEMPGTAPKSITLNGAELVAFKSALETLAK